MRSSLAVTKKKIKLLVSIKAAISIGKDTLNRYYDKTDHSEVFRIAIGTTYFRIFSYF